MERASMEQKTAVFRAVHSHKCLSKTTGFDHTATGGSEDRKSVANTVGVNADIVVWIIEIIVEQDNVGANRLRGS